MDPSIGIMSGGKCFDNQFNACFQGMSSIRPGGTGGTGIFTPSYPYGVSTVKEQPYGSSSVGRQPWEGWRYGSGYTCPNPGQVYGEPDYKYNRHEYCGPNGCGPPGYMGDPFGKNANIRYIPLDPRNILGTGLAPQNSEQTGALSLQNVRSDDLEVPNPTEPPLKFQINFGDSNKLPQTGQKQMKSRRNISPTYGPGGDQDGYQGNGQNFPEYALQSQGETGQTSSQGDIPNTNQPATTATKPKPSAFNDPCGNCDACKNMRTPGFQNGPTLVRTPQMITQQRQQQCQKIISQPQREKKCQQMISQPQRQVKGQRGQRNGSVLNRPNQLRTCLKK